MWAASRPGGQDAPHGLRRLRAPGKTLSATSPRPVRWCIWVYLGGFQHSVSVAKGDEAGGFLRLCGHGTHQRSWLAAVGHGGPDAWASECGVRAGVSARRPAGSASVQNKSVEGKGSGTRGEQGPGAAGPQEGTQEGPAAGPTVAVGAARGHRTRRRSRARRAQFDCRPAVQVPRSAGTPRCRPRRRGARARSRLAARRAQGSPAGRLGGLRRQAETIPLCSKTHCTGNDLGQRPEPSPWEWCSVAGLRPPPGRCHPLPRLCEWGAHGGSTRGWGAPAVGEQRGVGPALHCWGVRSCWKPDLNHGSRTRPGVSGPHTDARGPCPAPAGTLAADGTSRGRWPAPPPMGS